MPLSGFPTAWKRFLLVVFGVTIAYMAWHLIKEKKSKLKNIPQNSKTSVYKENRNFLIEKETPVSSDTTDTKVEL